MDDQGLAGGCRFPPRPQARPFSKSPSQARPCNALTQRAPSLTCSKAHAVKLEAPGLFAVASLGAARERRVSEVLVLVIAHVLHALGHVAGQSMGLPRNQQRV